MRLIEVDVTTRVILISCIQRGEKRRARNLHSPFRRSTSSLSRSDRVCMHYLHCLEEDGERKEGKKKKNVKFFLQALFK